jgi:hypothetical protein
MTSGEMKLGDKISVANTPVAKGCFISIIRGFYIGF